METSLAEIPLQIENLTFRYQRRSEPAIRNLNLKLEKGEILLVAGISGCGKTTLMRCINGLNPRTYRGEMKGSIRIFNKCVEDLSMAELSQNIGTLLQDPERQIVGTYVLNEVAFGLENLGIPVADIVKRVDDTLGYLGIPHLRDRETFHLSGGEKQKVALAGVLAMQPKILLLDEPLANLDPASAHEALQIFRKLADDGISIMLVEHRVEDALSILPECVLYLDEGKPLYYGDSNQLMEVVNYHHVKLPAKVVFERARLDAYTEIKPALPPPNPKALVQFEDVHFRYSAQTPEVLHGINCSVHAGDIIAILGHNGAGKTTLVKHALGLLKPTEGHVYLDEKETNQITVAQAAHTVGYVFQSPTQMLFAPTAREELSFGPKNLGHLAEQIEHDIKWAMESVHLEGEMETPPLALSFGQQKRLSIAAILAMRSRILMMDEPTAGQDYWNYTAFMNAILAMPGFDAIIFITHDIDLAICYANRILLMNNGNLIADGSPAEVMADHDRLEQCRVLPTSLLKLNQQYLPLTGRFMRAEALAQLVGKN